MDCFQDFCLHCDRDSPDGPYCSQQCKLADLERSNPSSPTSPTSNGSDRSWTSSHYRQQSTPSYTAPSSSGRPRSSYFMWTSTSQHPEHTEERQLTPSSSRTSLSSTTTMMSTTSSAGYSKEAKAQLNDYFNSFDQAKAAKRRSSLR